MESLAQIVEALEQSGFGAWARGSSYAYPAANLLHLLGLVMLVGGIGLFDLRLLGLFSSIPLQAAARILPRFAVAGFCVQVPSGLVLFAADAAPLVASPVFRWKMALVALGLANAVAFRLVWRRAQDDWTAPPAAAKVMSVVSLAVWLSVAALGRLIAYA